MGGVWEVYYWGRVCETLNLHIPIHPDYPYRTPIFSLNVFRVLQKCPLTLNSNLSPKPWTLIFPLNPKP